MSESSNLTKFIEFMSKDEMEIKQAAIKLIPNIISEISSNKLINDFLPFILNSIDDEDDELITEFLSIMPLIIPLQGDKSKTHKLLPFIELGLVNTKQKIREDSLEMYKIILKECLNNNKDFNSFEFLQKLSNMNHHKYKIAFIITIPVVYRHLNSSNKGKLLNLIKQISLDTNEQIKKALATNLKNLSCFIPEDIFSNIFNNLLESRNDNIRIQLIPSIVSLKHHESISSFKGHIKKVVNSVATDSCWRVRYTLASSCHDLLTLIPDSKSLKKEIINQYSTMFFDEEEEIRNITIQNFGFALEKLKDDDENINKLLDSFNKGVEQENSSIVKITLAEYIVSISKQISKPKFKQIIIPICNDLLKSNEKDLIKSGTTPLEGEKRKIGLSPTEKHKRLLTNSPLGSKTSLQKKNINILENYTGGEKPKIVSNSDNKDKEIIICDNSGFNYKYIQIQLKMISNIPHVSKLSSYNFEPLIISTIQNIYENSRWKNKVNVINIILEILPFFSFKSLAHEILDLLLKGIKENVYSIRESSIKCLVEILTNLQNDNIFYNVNKVLISQVTSNYFQMRKSCAMFILEYVKIKNISETFISNYLLSILIKLTTDKVNNIKVICGNTMSIIVVKNKSYLPKLSKYIEEYSKDIDEEVANSVKSKSL